MQALCYKECETQICKPCERARQKNACFLFSLLLKWFFFTEFLFLLGHQPLQPFTICSGFRAIHQLVAEHEPCTQVFSPLRQHYCTRTIPFHNPRISQKVYFDKGTVWFLNYADICSHHATISALS